MKFIGKIKNSFGFFSLSEFEQNIIDHLRENLDPHWKEVLDSQLDRFNKLERVLRPAIDLPFGHTSFYWTRFGRPRFDFPKRFPLNNKGEELARLQVLCDEGRNVINVSFVGVEGFLFTIKYRSRSKQFVPIGNYQIQNLHVSEKLKNNSS